MLCKLGTMLLAAASFPLRFSPEGCGFSTSLNLTSPEVLLQKEEFCVVLKGQSLWVIQTLTYPNTEAEGLLANGVPCDTDFGKGLLSVLRSCPYFYLASLLVMFPSHLVLVRNPHGCALHACRCMTMCKWACTQGHVRERKGVGCLLNPAANEVWG